MRPSMSDSQESGKWYVGFSHWGECFIERSCTKHDPQWKGTYINGIPTIEYMNGIYDIHLADDLVNYLNQIYEI